MKQFLKKLWCAIWIHNFGHTRIEHHPLRHVFTCKRCGKENHWLW
jgi:hypothetical protein